jgi:hypothetical protein
MIELLKIQFSDIILFVEVFYGFVIGVDTVACWEGFKKSMLSCKEVFLAEEIPCG